MTTRLDWDYQSQSGYDGFGRPAQQCRHRMPKGGGAMVSNCATPSYNAQGYAAQLSTLANGVTSTVWTALAQDADSYTTAQCRGRR